MATKPNFRSNVVSKVDLSSTLPRGAVSRVIEPVHAEPRPAAAIQERPAVQERSPVRERTAAAQPAARKQFDSRKKKLAHLKTLLEYEEKKDITNLLHDIGDIVGHTIQFSIFNRGLLLAALAQRDEFLRVAQKIEGLERPSNGDVEAFREYEAQIGQMIFDVFGVRGSAPVRAK